MVKAPRIMSHSDMARRWKTSLQVVTNRKNHHPDFPVPFARVSAGKVPLYWEDDVKRYEKSRPDMYSFLYPVPMTGKKGSE